MLSLFALVLFIFGPSCGGKSTLSKALLQQLGPSWCYLDRDSLIEKGCCTEEEADQTIEEKILFFESNSQNVIVDAQIPWRAPKKEKETYVLVYAPLSELLVRDARRTILLNRSSKRAYFAHLYVEETFTEVFAIPDRLNFKYDAVLDSSQYSVDFEAREVISLLYTRSESKIGRSAGLKAADKSTVKKWG